MLDRFNREISYLRISITDKCNLACQYCQPKNLLKHKSHSEILHYEEIYEIVKAAAELGINKVRLTGGEPLLRKDIAKLIALISSIKAIKILALTTNGTLLAQQAKQLKTAGLQAINISLDTLDPKKYKKITGGDIKQVLTGIDAALTENFCLKINMVVLSNINETEISTMQQFCDERKIKLQLIANFDLTKIKTQFCKFDRPPVCSECNRLRLLVDGTLKPCLHSDLEYKVDLQNIKHSLEQAILAKPENGKICLQRNMVEIGG